MSYRIAYGRKMHFMKTSIRHKRVRMHRVALAIFVCAALVCVLCSTQVRRLLLPGDKQITEAALGQLADDLRNGEPVYDSVVVFCREILEHA